MDTNTHTHNYFIINKMHGFTVFFCLILIVVACFFSVVGRILSRMALPFFQKRYQNKWVLCECMGISIVHITQFFFTVFCSVLFCLYTYCRYRLSLIDLTNQTIFTDFNLTNHYSLRIFFRSINACVNFIQIYFRFLPRMNFDPVFSFLVDVKQLCLNKAKKITIFSLSFGSNLVFFSTKKRERKFHFSDFFLSVILGVI